MDNVFEEDEVVVLERKRITDQVGELIAQAEENNRFNNAEKVDNFSQNVPLEIIASIREYMFLNAVRADNLACNEIFDLSSVIPNVVGFNLDDLL